MREMQLTEREQEVLKLLLEGKNNKEIARSLWVSVHTVKAHVCKILQKHFVNSRIELVCLYLKKHTQG